MESEKKKSRKPLLKVGQYQLMGREKEESTTDEEEEEEEEEDLQLAVKELKDAIRERELAERRLAEKLRKEMIRLQKERQLREDLNRWSQE